MPTYKVHWDGDKPEMAQIDTLLSEVLYPPADAVSLSLTSPDDAPETWRVEAFFTDLPDEAAMDTLLADHGLAVTGTLETLPEKDWVAHSLEGLGVVTCGRFVLYGIHDEARVEQRPGNIPIRIDANQAFGTGHHPTTAGCLEMLDRIVDHRPGKVLDLGTGSAVLAIAARKVWPETQITATDIDATSVEIAAENAALNGAEGVDFICAPGFDHPQIEKAAPFDFIFANILAGPLADLAPDMARYTTPDATVMLAGLLDRQETTVMTAYQNEGFALADRLDHPTWPVLLLKRQPA